MDRKKKIGLAVLVIAIGGAVALQFRKTDSTTANPEGTSQAPSVGTTIAPSGPVVLSDGLASKSGTSFAGGIESAPVDAATSRGSGSLTPVGPNSSTANRDDAERDQSLVNLNQPDKIHKIVDGDTLGKLAQRYWGRADRYVELYAYNRDVLSDPDVLPIGAELRIPSHVIVSRDPDLTSATPVLPLVPLSPPAAVPGTRQRRRLRRRNPRVSALTRFSPATI